MPIRYETGKRSIILAKCGLLNLIDQVVTKRHRPKSKHLFNIIQEKEYPCKSKHFKLHVENLN